jgi:hypothetical protein
MPTGRTGNVRLICGKHSEDQQKETDMPQNNDGTDMPQNNDGGISYEQIEHVITTNESTALI